MDKKFVEEDKCDLHVKFMSEKIDKISDKLTDFKEVVIEEFGKVHTTILTQKEEIMEKSRKEFANKRVEKEVKDMKEKNSNRIFDLFKLFIELVIASAVTFLSINQIF